MSSQAYLDVVGEVGRQWPASYDVAIKHACPRCGADPYEMCTNPNVILSNRAKIPCVARLTTAA
jgi:hypothetical protein